MQVSRKAACCQAWQVLLWSVCGCLLLTSANQVLYLSHFYQRTELALRIGLFYTAASLSGAFGGLLARGLSEIGPSGGLEGWRWILIIEGIITVLCAVLAWVLLPNSLETMHGLTTEQKAWARQRILYDSPVNALGERRSHHDEHLDWAEVRRGVFNVQVWLSATAYFGMLSGLYSFGLFLPTVKPTWPMTAEIQLTLSRLSITWALPTLLAKLSKYLSSTVNNHDC